MDYKRPPIIEAIIEFRWLEELPLQSIQSAATAIGWSSEDEPVSRAHVDAHLNLDKGTVNHRQTVVGYNISSPDGRTLAILETAKFAFVNRAPYVGWKEFCESALMTWASVNHVLARSELSRIAVRYINRIDIPPAGGGVGNTDDYINITFEGPRADNELYQSFQMRLVKPSNIPNVSYALAVASAHSPVPGHVGVVLDIDVFMETASSSDDQHLGETLGTLRNEKNEIFESSITSKSRDLFGAKL